MRLSLALVLMVCGSMAFSAEEPDSGRIDVRLSDTRWQPLPNGIQQVYIQKKGRTWFQCSPRELPFPALTAIRQHLASEFGQTSPQVRYVRLALFEPDGRVWFYAPSCLTLLGYDGAEWISYTIRDRLDALGGRCLTRGSLIDADVHRFVGPTAWFLGRRGVYRFDGKTWSYRQIVEGKPIFGRDVRLSVSPDGKLAVAHQRHTRTFSIFCGQRWSEYEVFPEEVFPEGDVPYVRHLVAGDSQNIWYVVAPGHLRRLAIGPDGQVTPAEGPGAAESATFGAVQVAGVRAMYQDQAGRIFVAADSIDDGRPQPQAGVAILQGDGQTRVLHGEALAEGWYPHYRSLPPPILTASGEQVWLPNRNTGKPAELLDLTRREVVETLPHSTFGCLHAVADGGRLFVARQNLGSDRQQIMVYTPGAPQPPTLATTRIEISSGPVAVGSDGAVWAVDPQQRLICFDHGQWKTLQPAPHARIRTLLPGKDGVMLIEADGGLILYRGTEKIASGGILELLEENRELVCRAFSAGRPESPTNSPLVLAASREGYLWCLYEKSVRLLVGNRWHDALDPLVAAGSRRGMVEYLAPIGDQGTVYVSDLNLRHDGGRSFFGRLKDGKLHFADAPHTMSGARPHLGIRDREGALWISSTRGVAGTTSDYITAQLAIRAKQGGVVQQFQNSGWARLADEAGNVWLGGIFGKTADVFKIWREGKIVQELHVPAYEKGLLFSDYPGSVYAYTVGGLQHLVADPPDFSQYRLDQLYSISDIAGSPRLQMYSKQGYMVVTAYAGSPKRKYYLHLVNLPANPAAEPRRSGLGG